eukprot:8263890-Lingulodinium_polyedra.AAC.1
MGSTCAAKAGSSRVPPRAAKALSATSARSCWATHRLLGAKQRAAAQRSSESLVQLTPADSTPYSAPGTAAAAKNRRGARPARRSAR